MNTRAPSVLRGVLSLVHAMGGKLEHRIRLQKAAYLLQQLGVSDFRPTSFRYHHYGPYSRGLSDAIQAAVASELLREEREEREGDVLSYTYVLTGEGQAWVLDNMQATDFATTRAYAPRLGAEHWRVLELAATTLFLERDEHLSRAAALHRALELKPACDPFRPKAEQLLGDLSL